LRTAYKYGRIRQTCARILQALGNYVVRCKESSKEAGILAARSPVCMRV
jgi:hypothetical protein